MKDKIERMKKDVLAFSEMFLGNFQSTPYQEEFVRKINTGKKITLKQPRIYPTFKGNRIPMIYEQLQKRDNGNSFDVIIMNELLQVEGTTEKTIIN